MKPLRQRALAGLGRLNVVRGRTWHARRQPPDHSHPYSTWEIDCERVGRIDIHAPTDITHKELVEQFDADVEAALQHYNSATMATHAHFTLKKARHSGYAMWCDRCNKRI